jgi:thiol-disulfide isomerase/thioredoxin
MPRPSEETYVFNSREHFLECLQLNTGLIIIKIGATWCGPCNNIKKIVNDKFHLFDENVICVNMDIDESKDTYSFLKNKRVFNGTIPAILCWYKDNIDCYPDDICQGSNIKSINDFFDRCIKQTEEYK